MRTHILFVDLTQPDQAPVRKSREPDHVIG